jgi:hypothetical protein
MSNLLSSMRQNMERQCTDYDDQIDRLILAYAYERHYAGTVLAILNVR